ncbi:hypothetical protein AMJ47_02245 [Parcubacteria bacterium DG_72]|nr:MAG: hypothetical protein AMJ47_02245 [Parcubacteria bacterium DG_72]
MINPVREKAFKIVKKAKDVKINKDKIGELARTWEKEKVKKPEWPADFHFKSLDYFFILDSINFCFWFVRRSPGKGGPKVKKWSIDYKGKKYNGYFALSLALKGFFEKNPEKANLVYFSNISQREFNSILQGGENLQFLPKRWFIVRQVSREIIKKYNSCKNLLNSTNNKLSNLVSKIEKLPYFKDPFLKRAQILASDIYGAGLAEFDDLDYLTAFADYKVPQILNHLGILEYSKSLDNKINNKILIAQGSKQEKEIRASNIWAVELLKKQLNNKFYSFEIDWILWNQAQGIEFSKPYHLTKTIKY